MAIFSVHQSQSRSAFGEVGKMTFPAEKPERRLEHFVNHDSGGLEMLFGNDTRHNVSIPAKDYHGNPTTIRYLISWLYKNLIQDPRRELFILKNTVYIRRVRLKSTCPSLSILILIVRAGVLAS